MDKEFYKEVETLSKPIVVPANIRYISDWTGYDLSVYDFPHILDKQIPGCGYTHYCLTNNMHLILTSPRRILLENKEEQLKGEVFYFKIDQDGLTVDDDLTRLAKFKEKKEELSEKQKEEKRKELEEKILREEVLKENLQNYITERLNNNKPLKIIVTYDSFGRLKDTLKDIGFIGNNWLSFNDFYIVVDEFQSIFVDSKFKSDTEIKLLNDLKGLQKVCFVSATPMMDEYLCRLPEFENLPRFRLDWSSADETRVIKPDLNIHCITYKKSVLSEAKKIIDKYKEGKFEILPDLNGNPVESREAVFYVNSVNNIISIIKKSELTPDQCNILCANTPKNVSKIAKKLNDKKYKFTIGSVPLKGEPHKMFTFCTRTVYLGADFYSTCARTFVMSDANVDNLAVDISLDLPQILGRQRLIENPWKNRADFYFKALGNGKVLTKQDFDKRIQKKIEDTNNLLSGYRELREKAVREVHIDKYEKDIIISRYRDDYLSVNKIYDEETHVKIDRVPIFNNLVLISEQRAFDIQQVDYKDRFSVFTAIKKSNFELDNKVNTFISRLKDTTMLYPLRLKLLCESPDFTEDEKKDIAREVSEAFDKYYNLLGPERCKACGYNTDKLNKEISDMLISKDDLRDAILPIFEVGKRYKNADIKETLKKIYSDLGLKRKTAKANDLYEYFELKDIKIYNSALKKQEHGYEILSIKPN